MRIRHIDHRLLDANIGRLAAQADDVANAHRPRSQVYLVQTRLKVETHSTIPCIPRCSCALQSCIRSLTYWPNAPLAVAAATLVALPVASTVAWTKTPTLLLMHVATANGSTHAL
jgi:hypothetical protein